MINTVQEQKYYAEVYKILKYLGSEYINKIPKNLLEVIDKTRDKESVFEVDNSKPLYEQKICQETKDFIAGLNLLYWENNKERKAKLLQIYKKNDIIYEKEQQEKYSYENLFRNNQNETKEVIVEEQKGFTNENTNTQLVEIKESFIRKIFLKIKNWFWRFRK